MSKIIIYRPNDGNVELKVSLDKETVWLSLTQISHLFNRDKSVISRHLSNIFKTEELNKDAVVANYAITAEDGKTYKVDHYNLDEILSVGYQINSKQGTHFRQWAISVLRDHLVKGYSIHKEQLAKKGLKALGILKFREGSLCHATIQ